MATSTAHIYKYLTLPDSLLQQLDQQRRDDFLCDITLKASGQEWRAHKCVLSAYSGYFKSVFAAYDATEVQLDPVTEKGFNALLDYMYTAKLVLTKETAQDILVAAGFLEIVNVLSDCSTYLSGPEEQPAANQPNSDGQKESTETGESVPPTQPQPVKRGRGRPKGSKGRPKQSAVLSDDDDDEVDLGKLVLQGDGPYTCDICQAQFTRRSKILAHRRRHAVERLFTCDICDEIFSKKGPYLSHRRTHNSNLTCRKCSAEFTDQKSLGEHIKEHTEDRFLCDECDRPFLSRSALIQHKRTHTGEKPFACKDCHKTFAQKTTLIRHCRSHTGEKPFVCDLCQKRFSEKGNMLTHRRIHTGEKPFKCETCETRFGKLSTLIQHRRQHTHKGEKPFVCGVCNASYTQKSHLVSHQKLKHMGQARFSCSVCSAQFDNKFHFTRHQRTHTGERPFQCDTCHSRFALKANLQRHQSLHSKEKQGRGRTSKRGDSGAASTEQPVQVQLQLPQGVSAASHIQALVSQSGETIPIRVTNISPDEHIQEVSSVSHSSHIQEIQGSGTTQTVQIVDLQANPENATQALLQLCSIDHDYPQ
ncbi:endothelial zinc finger protein induced by tumor necrosis factor alpha-like [Branchiostoma floridae]|uniref:Endothelial zinc finger protein induced by tumor necrosis factor alpha-like n=1 Tax=Branchiostoma floridae TaxID=7739 RepID=A0A9J7LIW9_BRAFL|nr:endothelial zinc finger protein induced by tumor necrosis factor alpha-like [Branchiostoma floridae]XP_035683623.1 endothelial zinc finger protein induced by tumor necrosis factor alpha-like [Branchiostoma floridae]XP_035683624.1 endothelial zinc finger protein induced by tumor necrosis factor alpha-like [Branchiostoma floridae]